MYSQEYNGIADNSYFIGQICVNGSIPFPSQVAGVAQVVEQNLLKACCRFYPFVLCVGSG